jgi:hypothetical protein
MGIDVFVDGVGMNLGVSLGVSLGVRFSSTLRVYFLAHKSIAFE